MADAIPALLYHCSIGVFKANDLLGICVTVVCILLNFNMLIHFNQYEAGLTTFDPLELYGSRIMSKYFLKNYFKTYQPE